MSEMFLQKYKYVAMRTRGYSGNLLDMGARDRILEKYLEPHTQTEGLRYLSADVIPGHDYQINLEQPVVLKDQQFDIVVALDVLEHLENPHQALKELIRITRRKVFISLPNPACLSFRLRFFREGRLSDKYALLPQHQGDRHRWLTTYDQAQGFVKTISEQHGCIVEQYDIAEDSANYGKLRFLIPAFLLSARVRTYTMLFEITKS